MFQTDDDMKIYEGEPAPPERTPGEESARQYVAHRENGNLEKTRQLGELLAQTLVGDSSRLAGDPCYRQKLVLLSFLVSDELEAGLTDGILLKSAAAAFRNKVEELDPEKNRVRVTVSMFGRDTPVELELDQAEPIG